MGEHPTVEEIRSFTQGDGKLETARELVTHLLRGCPPCREETARQSRMGTSAGPVSVPLSYDVAFERAAVFKLPVTGMVTSTSSQPVRGTSRPCRRTSRQSTIVISG